MFFSWKIILSIYLFLLKSKYLKCILSNISLQVKLFPDVFLGCGGELDKHPIDYSAEDHLSRFSFSSPVSNCTSMFIDYRQLPTRSEIYCEKKRDEYLFQIQAKTPPHGWLNLFAQHQLFHLFQNCVFCDSTFAVKHISASPVWQQHGVSAWKPTPAFSKSVRWAFWPNFSWMWNCELHNRQLNRQRMIDGLKSGRCRFGRGGRNHFFAAHCGLDWCQAAKELSQHNNPHCQLIKIISSSQRHPLPSYDN